MVRRYFSIRVGKYSLYSSMLFRKHSKGWETLSRLVVSNQIIRINIYYLLFDISLWHDLIFSIVVNRSHLHEHNSKWNKNAYNFFLSSTTFWKCFGNFCFGKNCGHKAWENCWSRFRVSTRRAIQKSSRSRLMWSFLTRSKVITINCDFYSFKY